MKGDRDRAHLDVLDLNAENRMTSPLEDIQSTPHSIILFPLFARAWANPADNKQSLKKLFLNHSGLNSPSNRMRKTECRRIAVPGLETQGRGCPYLEAAVAAQSNCLR